jgi:hypothetical protein
MVASSGLRVAEVSSVRASEAWGPLMAAFRDAESRGLDLDGALAALIQGRTLTSADDLASLIHGRVTKWIESAGDRMQADRIVGLFPAAGRVNARDVDRALQERRTLIEENARTLVLNALRRPDPWILSIGRPPADPVRREEWLRRLDSIAAYRDWWQVSGNAILGIAPSSREQMSQRQAGQRAVSAALDAAWTVNSSGDVVTEIAGLEPGTR